MLRDYIGKIRACLDESNSLIPYPIETFYCSLKSLSQSIPSSEITHMTIERFSIIYNFLKNEIKTGGSLENRKKLVSELSDFLLSFRKHVRNEDVSKAIIRHFDDANFL